LTINTGSSSLKVEAFDHQEGKLASVFRASAKNIGSKDSTLVVKLDESEVPQQQPVLIADHKQAMTLVLQAFDRHFKRSQLACVAHRVVHGGTTFTRACRLDAKAIDKLRALVVLAPDHMPQALAAIDFFREHFKQLIQVAAFDTTFHAEMPERASHYALPAEFAARGVRRFGFHGLSYTYIVETLKTLEPALDDAKLIVAHLGSGASVAAIEHGHSIDTSMGFSPDSGLVMASRAGDFDASAVLYLMQHEHMSADHIDQLLNKNAGLKGMAGHGGDMHKLLQLRATDGAARLAIEMFCYRIKSYIGRYAAALGGCQMLVFTGGIGENSAEIREQVCQGLQFMGVDLDLAANRSSSAVISRPSGAVKIRVIATDEDLVIAQQAAALMHA
jgi:acetate kinase